MLNSCTVRLKDMITCFLQHQENVEIAYKTTHPAVNWKLEEKILILNNEK